MDAICVVRNMIRDNYVVGGGGATELSCALKISKEADEIKGIEQYAVRAFADALEEIPMTLAENSGFNSIEYVSKIKKMQVEESSPMIGVDAMSKGTHNMYEQGIFESVASKKQQLQLCLLYTSPSPRDLSTSRMPSSA